ncbi:MAG: DNA recombination protein RmuC, partial [Alphaproteobacteria bacterium]|nr:DNA recombination protein RmuC [Alphaproteobacteria bacterium]
MELFEAIAILEGLPGGLAAAALATGLGLGALGAWLAMRGRLATERRVAAERLRAREEAEARLGDSFRALSAEALQRNNAMFLDLARERLAQGEQRASGELERREQAVAALVAPVREALEKMDARLGELEARRAGAFGELRGEVERLAQASETLRSETARLAQSLRSPVARGRWGEVQLRRVVELAGMLAHCDFVEQSTIGAERRMRPDMIVRLPGGKTVVVDAKAPLEAYLDAAETEDEEARRARLLQHAADVKGHMRRLAERGYAEQFDEAPEFVV